MGWAAVDSPRQLLIRLVRTEGTTYSTSPSTLVSHIHNIVRAFGAPFQDDFFGDLSDDFGLSSDFGRGMSFSRETVTVRRTESVRERNTVDSFGRTTRTVNYSGLDADTKAKVDSILDQFMTR